MHIDKHGHGALASFSDKHACQPLAEAPCMAEGPLTAAPNEVAQVVSRPAAPQGLLGRNGPLQLEAMPHALGHHAQQLAQVRPVKAVVCTSGQLQSD